MSSFKAKTNNHWLGVSYFKIKANNLVVVFL